MNSSHAPWLAALLVIAACGSTPPAAKATAPSAPATRGDPPGSVDITGVVRAPDGAPVAGAHVAINLRDGVAALARTRSGTDGTFRVQVPAGSYVLTATANGHAATTTQVEEFDADGHRTPRVLRLGADGFTVRGAMAHADGKPAHGVSLRIYRITDEGLDMFYTQSDDQGRYELALAEVGEGLVFMVEDPGWHLSGLPWVDEARDQTVDLTVHSRTPASQEVVRWIADNAVPLATVVAGNGWGDMARLGEMVGDARVVGLGEATHGTREFFQLKHRIFEYLVENLGFTVFSIEAHFTECLAINDYVLRGQGDPRKALDGLSGWPWQTEEVLELIEWMRRYNDDPAHANKLAFYGYDMQSVGGAASKVAEYLAVVDSRLGEAWTQTMAPLVAEDVYTSYPARSVAEKSATREAIGEILAKFDRARDRYVATTGEEAFAIARQNLVVVSQAEEMIANPAQSFEVRDRSMAANVQWILRHHGPGTRVVAWAGNGHVQRSEVLGSKTMGTFLDQALGDRYVPFGFTFNRGSYQARYMPPGEQSEWGLKQVTVGPAPPGNVGDTFGRARIPILALDLRRRPRAGAGRPAHPATAWLESPHLMRNLGATHRTDESTMFPHLLTASFDVVLFVHETTRARPIEAVRD